MKDNIEGGSRDAASARQDPAPASSEQATRTASVTGTAMGMNGESRQASADMQHFIGRQLRAVFDDVAKQPIPDRFLELMKQLDSKTGT